MLSVPIETLTTFQTRRVRLATLTRLSLDIGSDGVKSPVRVMDMNGKYVVLDGAHRVLAARIVGLEEMPIEIVDQPTDFMATAMDICDISQLIAELDKQLDKFTEIHNRLVKSRTREPQARPVPTSSFTDE